MFSWRWHDNSRGVWQQGSGDAEGAGGGSESADRCEEAIVGGVSKGEEEEEEEEDPQHVGGEDGYAVGVLQRCADGGETHVVAERVAEHRTHQVTCNTEEEETLTLDLQGCKGTWIPPKPLDAACSGWYMTFVGSVNNVNLA